MRSRIASPITQQLILISVLLLTLGPPVCSTLTSFCEEDGWEIVWADEFEGQDLDTRLWTKFVGPPGNSRTREATGTADNVYIQDGSLVLRTHATVWNTSTSSWDDMTTGAVESRGKLSFQGPARICVSAKLPGGGGGKNKKAAGKGIWPAHWLMPDDTSCWPCHGEIDIMEMINGDGTVYGTYHWCRNSSKGSKGNGGGSGSSSYYDDAYFYGSKGCKGSLSSSSSSLKGSKSSSGSYSKGSRKEGCGDNQHAGGNITMNGIFDGWATEWHEYAVEYGKLDHGPAFALDGLIYHQVPGSGKGTELFPEVPYYMILNTAVGGPWADSPDETTQFPTFHYIDSVRVALPTTAVAW